MALVALAVCGRASAMNNQQMMLDEPQHPQAELINDVIRESPSFKSLEDKIVHNIKNSIIGNAIDNLTDIIGLIKSNPIENHKYIGNVRQYYNTIIIRTVALDAKNPYHSERLIVHPFDLLRPLEKDVKELCIHYIKEIPARTFTT